MPASRCFLFVFIQICLTGSLVAQDTASNDLSGKWTYCFPPDVPTYGGRCAVFEFAAAPSCAGEVARYTLLPRVGSMIRSVRDTVVMYVGYRVTGHQLHFGGQVQPDTGGVVFGPRCGHSADDGSLTGAGTVAADSITGEWYRSGYVDIRLGRFTLRRDHQ